MIAFLLIGAAIFGLCFLVDKGFTKLFRNSPQHQTGLSVRLNKRFAVAGVLLTVLGIAGTVAGAGDGWALLTGGILLALSGICMLIYYGSFGVYYDDDSFLLSKFGRKTNLYHYRDIVAQQLYNAYGSIVIELQLKDGKTIQLQASMVGVYPFLDRAFAGWLKQKGKKQEDCDFYDPDNSCWFPPAEV